MLTDTLYSFGDSRFSCRIKAINEMIRTHKPDLIGVQELTPRMFGYLDTIFEDYGMIGEDRHSAVCTEYAAVFYRKDRFTVLKQNTFWLSPFPEIKGSKYAFSQFPRITVYALFKDAESKEEFTFFNTHLDQVFPFVRKRQAAVLRDLIVKYREGSFAAVTGDFNAVPDSGPLRIVCSAGLKDTSKDSLGSTLRGRIGSAIQRNRPIDHILISEYIESYRLVKLDRKYSGYWVSDHFPLMIEFHV